MNLKVCGVVEFTWSSWKIPFLLKRLLLWRLGGRAIAVRGTGSCWGCAMEVVLYLLLLFLMNFFPSISWREAPFITCNIWHLKEKKDWYSYRCTFVFVFSLFFFFVLFFSPFQTLVIVSVVGALTKRKGLFFGEHKIRSLLS